MLRRYVGEDFLCGVGGEVWEGLRNLPKLSSFFPRQTLLAAGPELLLWQTDPVDS